MKITLLAFGKLKTVGLRDSANYYKKLISKYSEITEVELRPVPLKSKSKASFLDSRQKEAKLLERAIAGLGTNTKAIVLILDEKAKPLRTMSWVSLISELRECGQQMIFILGSSAGVDSKFAENVPGSGKTIKIGLGPQTLSHELARVVLYEQLFRVLSNMNGHTYHHEI